jgi:hypothetical protein
VRLSVGPAAQEPFGILVVVSSSALRMEIFEGYLLTWVVQHRDDVVRADMTAWSSFCRLSFVNEEIQLDDELTDVPMKALLYGR